MDIIKKLLLGTSILTMSLLFGVNLFTQVKYERVDATMDLSGLILASSNIGTVKDRQGLEVYIASNDKYEGMDSTSNTWRVEDNKSKLSKFVITNIDEDNNVYLFFEGTKSYVRYVVNNFEIFEDNKTTPNAVKLESDGKITANFNDSDYYLGYSNGRRVGFHLYSDIKYFYNLYVVPVEEMSPTNQFGYALLNDLTCDSSGATPPSKAMWENLKNKYTSLGFEEDTFKSVNADKDSPITISKALAKYDYIMSKYGSSEYENFLNRDIVPLNNIHVIDINNMNDNNDALMIFIIMSSLISVVAFIYMYNRKKKDR